MRSINLNILVSSAAVLSFLGFVDASYLTAKHYLGTPIPCSILNGCDTVTTSVYSEIAGLPVALLGAIYYLGIFLICVFYLESKNTRPLKFLATGTTIAFIFSLYLIYLQIFTIKALCLYCLISAFLSLILFMVGILIFKKYRTPLLTG